jgi:hypothetical protein
MDTKPEAVETTPTPQGDKLILWLDLAGTHSFQDSA